MAAINFGVYQDDLQNIDEFIINSETNPYARKVVFTCSDEEAVSLIEKYNAAKAALAKMYGELYRLIDQENSDLESYDG